MSFGLGTASLAVSMLTSADICVTEHWHYIVKIVFSSHFADNCGYLFLSFLLNSYKLQLHVTVASISQLTQIAVQQVLAN